MNRIVSAGVYPLLMLAAFAAGTISGGSRAARAESDIPSLVYVTGDAVSVYYPAQKRVYVYTPIGGNCVFAYTLSTPGGFMARENCK